jgi:hypothetical protein
MARVLKALCWTWKASLPQVPASLLRQPRIFAWGDVEEGAWLDPGVSENH